MRTGQTSTLAHLPTAFQNDPISYALHAQLFPAIALDGSIRSRSVLLNSRIRDAFKQ